MRKLDAVGAADGWRCWLCDEPVDPAMSVNDPRGPSIDSVLTKAQTKRSGPFANGGSPAWPGDAQVTRRIASMGPLDS